ncbi:hypothetical protein V6N13_104618 [Hibiscus sabdariffa]|uniref:Uncharacterized protein n=1 Tax=Hibiscus sabdariffa TaxID=183260 RepID=A0ABR2DD94_9ROSI
MLLNMCHGKADEANMNMNQSALNSVLARGKIASPPVVETSEQGARQGEQNSPGLESRETNIGKIKTMTIYSEKEAANTERSMLVEVVVAETTLNKDNHVTVRLVEPIDRPMLHERNGLVESLTSELERAQSVALQQGSEQSKLFNRGKTRSLT